MILRRLPFTDFVNAIVGKLHFETVVDGPKIFIEVCVLKYQICAFQYISKSLFFLISACEEMKVLQNEFVTDRSKAIKRFKSILDVGRKLMRSPIYKAVTFIMLWKLISKFQKIG